MATGIRRRGRVLALQALYEADTSHHVVEEVLERMVAERPEPRASEFARRLIEGIQANRTAIDEILAAAAPQWPVSDVARIDRNVLRIAIYEVRFDNETPIRAAVNEAIELAKLYGGESSPRFVNGVLGTVAEKATR
ncbi:MAG: transcription antitermination factor NusB [Chloroflexi bacterium]|nr:transcription antitermination factor NusB [Chloroflexota bacterium]